MSLTVTASPVIDHPPTLHLRTSPHLDQVARMSTDFQLHVTTFARNWRTRRRTASRFEWAVSRGHQISGVTSSRWLQIADHASSSVIWIAINVICKSSRVVSCRVARSMD